jgi:hypothetical protein
MPRVARSINFDAKNDNNKDESSVRITMPREATSNANEETSYYETSSRYSKVSK